jgi:hypothetical protein
LSTDDARVWAKGFVETVREHPDIPMDVATMEGWFANAMCVARDMEERRRLASTVPGLTPAQQVLQEKHGTPEMFEEAIWKAHAQLFVTTDEAVTAINKYRQEWTIAGDTPPKVV